MTCPWNTHEIKIIKTPIGETYFGVVKAVVREQNSIDKSTRTVGYEHFNTTAEAIEYAENIASTSSLQFETKIKVSKELR